MLGCVPEITHVQIMTDDGLMTATVDSEKRVSAAYQNIRRIPSVLVEYYGSVMEVLDLSHNKIRDVSPLRCLPNLHTLILDHNLIVSTSNFPRIPSLRLLSLNHNLVSEASLLLPSLRDAFPGLRHLSLMGNAASLSNLRTSEDKLDSYRLQVISYLDELRYLDDRPVTRIERLRSRPLRSEGGALRGALRYFHDRKETVLGKLRGSFNAIV